MGFFPLFGSQQFMLINVYKTVLLKHSPWTPKEYSTYIHSIISTCIAIFIYTCMIMWQVTWSHMMTWHVDMEKMKYNQWHGIMVGDVACWCGKWHGHVWSLGKTPFMENASTIKIHPCLWLDDWEFSSNSWFICISRNMLILCIEPTYFHHIVGPSTIDRETLTPLFWTFNESC